LVWWMIRLWSLDAGGLTASLDRWSGVVFCFWYMMLEMEADRYQDIVSLRHAGLKALFVLPRVDLRHGRHWQLEDVFVGLQQPVLPVRP
jgi:hypothetical protein